MVAATANGLRLRLQKDDIQNLLSFLHLKERFKDITFQDGENMLRNIKLKSGNAHGVNAVMQVLCQQADYSKEFLGRSAEERALTRQWLEYNDSFLTGNQLLTASTLKELDGTLRTCTFFSGHGLTIADFFIYFSLYPTMKRISFQDKEMYPHLSRWFRLIQEVEEARGGSRQKVVFSRTPLY